MTAKAIMTPLFNQLKKIIEFSGKRPEFCLLAVGVIVRIVFVVFVAKSYYGRDDIHIDGDTYSFAYGFQNLIETGEFTVNPGLEYGYFGRMPGYPFFIGTFYLLTGHNWEAAFSVISWVQLLIDMLSGWLLFLIALRLSNNRRIALISLFLYMLYPFVIVWTPVIYAETLGVSLCLLAFCFFIRREKKVFLLLSGLSVGCGILVRPQLILLVPAMLVIVLIENRRHFFLLARQCLLFMLPVIIVYGAWPVRNYMNHGKIILTQDSRGFYNWNIDVMAFWSYIYSVKSEWDPQYTQIISNQKVIFPPESYRTKEDSALLERAVYLAQHCGSGFSHKKGYWKESFDEPNCNAEIQQIFLQLRENQIKYNPWNFYVGIPLENLRKALFKTTLYDTGNSIRKLASLLFYYRSLLLLAGLAFYIILLKKKEYRNLNLLLPLVFFSLLYLLLCAGTSIPLRNIEMRYFLPADVLLLLPAAYLAEMLFTLLFFRNRG